MSRSVMLSCRVPVELADLIAERADDLSIHKSVLLRSLIEAGLGNTEVDAQIREAIYRMRPIIARTMAEASAEAIGVASSRLEELLRERLAQELAQGQKVP